MRGRVKGLINGPSPDAMVPEQPHPNMIDPDAQRQALQVLVLAQRTADDHVASAQHQAGTIRADAQAAAEQVARDAQVHADGVRQDAAKAIADARGKAEQIVRDAQAHAGGLRRDADKALSDARAGAAEIIKDAQANATGLDREAQQRYDEVVGTLERKRVALQDQIDSLEQFDRDYRSRLRSFMQSQLRALGVAEPVLNGDIQPIGAPTQPLGAQAANGGQPLAE
jgi:vacuolar-type H+-ATPase subunit H